MRVSELSERSGLPIATIKYYLREGLLPQGKPTAANQAEYDGEHVRRLRLIRALVEVGALPLATVREVLEAVDDTDLPIHEALGVAHRALAPEMPRRDDPTVADARADVDRFLEQLDWQVSLESPCRHELAVTLSTLRRLGWHDADARLFLPYARAANRIAAREVARTTPPGATRSETMERVVLGTVLFEAAFSALRRLAQERHSAARFSSDRSPGP